MDWTALLTSLLAVIIASSVGWITVRSTRKKLIAEAHKLEAEAGALTTEAAIALIGPLKERIQMLEEQIFQLRSELAEMKKVEEYLEAALYQKDKELDAARKRIAHLEEVCRKAGINGEDNGR